jgi:hypothetical protein
MTPSWRTVLILLVGVAVVGGCSRSANATPSTFFSSANLDALIKAAAPKELAFSKWGGGESGVGPPFRRNKEWHAEFRGSPESVDGLRKSLKEQLQDAVKKQGGQISQLKDLERPRGVNGFRFEYVEGAAAGSVRVAIEPAPGELMHKLSMKINEPPEA